MMVRILVVLGCVWAASSVATLLLGWRIAVVAERLDKARGNARDVIAEAERIVADEARRRSARRHPSRDYPDGHG